MKFTKRSAPGVSGGVDKYLKFKDGESKSLAFKGEIFEFYQKWPKGGQKEIFDKPTPGASSRFRVNVVELGKPTLEAKIWEFPVSVYNKLADINSEYPIETTTIKITKQVVREKTEWLLLPLLKTQLPQGLNAVDLHILNNRPIQKPEAQPNGWDGYNVPMPDESDEPLPF